MRYLKHSIFSLALLLSTLAGTSYGQTTAADLGFSPYSLFGLGQLSNQGTAYNATMGGIGIGDRNIRYINILNPAAVTSREQKSFMMDFGLNENNVIYEAGASASAGQSTSGTLRSANNTFNMNHIVLSFPIESHSAFKLGIKPYSNVGYSLSSYETSDALTAELGDIRYTKIGQGSIYDAFFGAGVTLWKRLSLGVDAEYYFGNIVRYSYATFNTNQVYRSMNTGWDNYLNGITAKFGLQYSQLIGKKMVATLGATAKLGTNLKGESRRFCYGMGSATDTIVDATTALSGYTIPAEFGAGFTLRHTDKWMIGFDYVRSDWTTSNLEATPGVNFAAATQQDFRAGVEFTPNRYDIRYFFRRFTYHAGVYYQQSYVSLDGHQISDRGLTFGLSMPVSRYFNSMTFGVNIGQRGALVDNLTRETYVTFNIAFSMHDIWFLKQMYE